MWAGASSDFFTYGFEECDWDAQCMYEAERIGGTALRH